MYVLKATGISHHYGVKTLLDDVSFLIKKGDRIGLIGLNGSGKSTLLNILSGAVIPDQGQIERFKDQRLVYLSQNKVFDPKQTILEAILSDGPIEFQAVKRYENALIRLLSDGGSVRVQEEYQAAEEEMEQAQAWDTQTFINTLLTQLKLGDPHRLMGTLSGGEKKRVALAQVLAQKSDILLLDEPTNHLDYASIQWLSQYLAQYPGTILFITHDRYFLDTVATKIYALTEGHISEYQGNYEQYLLLKSEEEVMQQKLAHKQQRLYQQELAWMRSGIKARGTRQKARQERFLSLKKSVKEQSSALEHHALSSAEYRLGKKVLVLDHAFYETEDRCFFKDLTLRVLPQDRIGIIGPNGIGKSTFFDLLAGKKSWTRGTYELGPTVRIGYYTQEHIDMNEDQRVIQYLTEQAGHQIKLEQQETSVTEWLERFLFPRSMHGMKIHQLSGGEKKRLYLLGILAKGPNVLLLDEPTNDFDVETLTVLEQYLTEFSGAVLSISHDRYFLDKMAEKLWVIQEDHTILETTEDVVTYFEQMTLHQQKEKQKTHQARLSETVETSQKPKVKTTLTWKEKQELAQLEEELVTLEAEIEAVECEMQELADQYEQLAILQDQKEQLEQQYYKDYERWEELSAYVSESF